MATDKFFILDRLFDTGKETFGALYDIEGYRYTKTGTPLCYTLEDTRRFEKVYGETRIPRGTYRLRLRKVGRLHRKYRERFDFHEGMIELMNVENFKYIYLHIGNTDKDTKGCILLGNAMGRTNILYSTLAYKRVYKIMVEFIKSDEFNTFLIVNDEGR